MVFAVGAARGPFVMGLLGPGVCGLALVAGVMLVGGEPGTRLGAGVTWKRAFGAGLPMGESTAPVWPAAIPEAPSWKLPGAVPGTLPAPRP